MYLKCILNFLIQAISFCKHTLWYHAIKNENHPNVKNIAYWITTWNFLNYICNIFWHKTYVLQTRQWKLLSRERISLLNEACDKSLYSVQRFRSARRSFWNPVEITLPSRRFREQGVHATLAMEHAVCVPCTIVARVKDPRRDAWRSTGSTRRAPGHCWRSSSAASPRSAVTTRIA